MGKCVIVGAGDFFGVRGNLKNDDYVIAADGGYDHLYEAGIIPNLIIGDMDSSVKRCEDIETIILPTKKDDTDMIAAMREGLKRGYTRFEIYGALGGRLDHTLANIQSLMFLKNHGASGIIFGKKESLELISNEKLEFDANMEGMISVFAYGGDAHGVTLKGLMYEVEDATLESGMPLGVSNEFVDKASYIKVTNGKLLVHVHNAKN